MCVLDYDSPTDFTDLGSITVNLIDFDFENGKKTLFVKDRKLKNVKSGSISIEVKFKPNLPNEIIRAPDRNKSFRSSGKNDRSSKNSMVSTKALVLVNKAAAKFKEMDTDNSGFLDGTEIDSLIAWSLETYQRSPDEIDEYKAELMARLDKDYNGKISLRSHNLF